MKRNFQLSLLAFFLFFQHNLLSQEMISGKLNNWQNSDAKIVNLDLFTGDTRYFGEIDEEGNIKIPLKKNFLSKIKKELKKKQEEATDNQKITLKTLQGTYSCLSGDLSYENAENNLTALPKMFFVMNAEEDLIGLLMPVSNPAIAKWHSSFGKQNTGKGKYVEWVYF